MITIITYNGYQYNTSTDLVWNPKNVFMRPAKPSMSLMRPLSQFEFETPVLKERTGLTVFFSQDSSGNYTCSVTNQGGKTVNISVLVSVTSKTSYKLQVRVPSHVFSLL
jgi:hypothetical protein